MDRRVELEVVEANLLQVVEANLLQLLQPLPVIGAPFLLETMTQRRRRLTGLLPNDALFVNAATVLDVG